jgi:outer membrane protein
VKNISNIVTGVLAVAVLVLFYLHFTSRQEIAEVRKTQEADTTPDLSFSLPKNLQGAKVLYVNIDSINQNYKAFSDLSKEAGSNLQGQMAVYQKKAADLQARYSQLQEKVNMGTISTDDASKEEASINAGLDELKRMETNLAYLESNAMQQNDKISQEIALYFHDYAKDKGIDYILMYGTNMPVIYANDSLDITNDVLVALNANYDQKKQEAPAKK